MAEADLSELDAGAAARRYILVAASFCGQISEIAQLVDCGEQVVIGFQLLAKL